MTAIQIPQTQIGRITARAKNQGVLFSVSTGSLSDPDIIEIFKLQDMTCSMLIAPVDEENPNIKEIKSEVDKKPPSQRLRGVLYVLWEQNPEGHKGFNTYYEVKMEGIIEHLKGKIV